MVGKTNTADVSVDPAIALGFTVTGYNGTYDRESHGVTPSVSPAYESTTTYRYSINGTSWRTSPYTYSACGTYTVYVQARNTAVGSVILSATITITPAYVTLTADSLSTTYNGSVQSVNSYTSSVSGITFRGVTASGSGTNAGTYKVTFSGVTVDETKDTTGNYIVHELVEGTITIAKASAQNLGLTVTGYNGMYDGSAHTVSVSVYNSSGTTYKYSTDNSTWRSSPYYLTNVGSLRVYVRAYNDNYNTASGYADIVITQAKATLIVTWPSGQLCSLFYQVDENTNETIFQYQTSGSWSGTPSKTGTYWAMCSNVDPNVKSTTVSSMTSGTYYIQW